MTIVSTIIASNLTMHCADSLITQVVIDSNGVFAGYEPLRYNARKIVRVETYAGAMSFWGLAQLGVITTEKWLKQQVGQAKHLTAEEFANYVASEIQKKLNTLKLKNDAYYGIGIHFTAYEQLDDGDWVPELFLISNFQYIKDYSQVDRHKVHVRRCCYHHLKLPGADQPSVHGQAQYRRAVRDFLKEDQWHWFIFNNGDPLLFNPIASGIITTIQHCRLRNTLDNSNRMELLKTVGTISIETVSKIQKSVYRSNQQVVGGRAHWLGINAPGRPTTMYESTTGD